MDDEGIKSYLNEIGRSPFDAATSTRLRAKLNAWAGITPQVEQVIPTSTAEEPKPQLKPIYYDESVQNQIKISDEIIVDLKMKFVIVIDENHTEANSLDIATNFANIRKLTKAHPLFEQLDNTHQEKVRITLALELINDSRFDVDKVIQALKTMSDRLRATQEIAISPIIKEGIEP